MNRVYFISEKTLREQSLINDNVDSVFLNNAIESALTIGLQEVIGSKLYNSLKAQIVAGEFTSDYYKTLLDDYIQPYLINRIMADITIPLQFKLRNSGIITNNDQHYQTASLNEVEYVKNYYEHNSVYNSNRIIEYIKDNEDQFTELKDDKSWIKLSRNTTKAPVYFPK